MTDCMQLATRHHEPVFAHATRVLHNLFHPHHKVAGPVFVTPAAALAVCSAPQLETVTVSAPAWQPPLGDDPSAPAGHSFGGGYSSMEGGGFGHSVLFGGGGYAAHPVTCPELSDDGAAAAILFGAGLLAVICARYRAR